MNTHTLKIRRILAVVGVTATVGALVISISLASNSHDQSAATRLSKAPVLELPELAAQIVDQASAQEKEAVVRQVIPTVAALTGPEMLAQTAGSICRVAPDMAGAVTTAAVASYPGEAMAIAKESIAAAPESVEAIASAAGLKVSEINNPVAKNASAKSEAVQAKQLASVKLGANAVADRGSMVAINDRQVMAPPPPSYGLPFNARPGGSPRQEIGAGNTAPPDPGYTRDYSAP